MLKLKALRAVWLSLVIAERALASTATIEVQTDKPGASINPAMWGIFFEDINFGADGGLYAELVKNRGFEFPDPMMGWSKLSPSLAQGRLSILNDQPFNAANPHYLRIESEAQAPFGVEFANGPVTAEWGAKRAALGHPAPFQMKNDGDWQ